MRERFLSLGTRAASHLLNCGGCMNGSPTSDSCAYIEGTAAEFAPQHRREIEREIYSFALQPTAAGISRGSAMWSNNRLQRTVRDKVPASNCQCPAAEPGR